MSSDRLKMSWEKVSRKDKVRDQRIVGHVIWGAVSAGAVGCGLGAYFQWNADVGAIRNAILVGEFSFLGGGAIGSVTGRIHDALVRD